MPLERFCHDRGALLQACLGKAFKIVSTETARMTTWVTSFIEIATERPRKPSCREKAEESIGSFGEVESSLDSGM